MDDDGYDYYDGKWYDLLFQVRIILESSNFLMAQLIYLAEPTTKEKTVMHACIPSEKYISLHWIFVIAEEFQWHNMESEGELSKGNEWMEEWRKVGKYFPGKNVGRKKSKQDQPKTPNWKFVSYSHLSLMHPPPSNSDRELYIFSCRCFVILASLTLLLRYS